MTRVENLLLACMSCVSEDAVPALFDKEEEIYHLSLVLYHLTGGQCKNTPDTHSDVLTVCDVTGTVEQVVGFWV